MLEAETRRATKGEPVPALRALDALDEVPPLARLRLLTPLVSRLKRRKVRARAEELLEAAAKEAGVNHQEREIGRAHV